MSLFLMIFSIFLLCVSSLGWIWQDNAVTRNKEGNQLYSEGKIDEALSKWRDAQTENPDKKELHYNIGNGLYQQKKYEDAYEEYEKSLDSKDAEFQAKAYYNMGNTRYRKGEMAKAIEDYKRCLDIDPDDEDAKYNIEFIRRKLKESAEKQQGMQRDAKKDESQDAQARQQESQQGQTGEEGQEPGKAQPEDEKEKAAEEKEGAGISEKEEEKAEDKKQKADQKEGEMSEEDAVRLLDALKDDEMELQRQLRMRPKDTRYRVDKDW